MSVSLQSGTNMSLTKVNPLIDDLILGFGWNVLKSNGPEVDLVPSVIAVDSSGKALSDDHFVFFNQLSTPDGSVQYVVGDDVEQVDVKLSLVPTNVQKLVFVVYVDPDVRKPGNFGAVRGAYVRVADKDNSEIVRFDVPSIDMSITAMIFGELYRHNGEWKFRAVGQGYTSGIVGVAKDFGVSL